MDDIRLKNRYVELAQRAWNTGRYTYTPFLNLAELDLLAQIKGEIMHIPCTLWGGAEDADRKLARFGDEALCGYEEDMPVACIRIAPVQEKFADDLTHRDYLGALMNLGIERDNLGDIRVVGKTGYVFCLSRLADYIADHLEKVRHTTVACTVVEGLPGEAVQSTEAVQVRVQSQRLDAVIAQLYHLSRAEAQGLFAGGKVFVNDRMQEGHSYTPAAGDVISLRGYGKFVYSGVTGTSKKGKYIVTVHKYV